MIDNIKKAVIVLEDSDENFFPLTRSIPKELLPLGDIPFVQYIVDEVIKAGAEEVNVISSTEKKIAMDHFKSLEKIPPGNEEFQKKYEKVSFRHFPVKKNSQSGQVFSRLKTKMNGENFIFSFSDTLLHGKKSSLEQLTSVYKTSQKTVVALKEVAEEEVATSYIVKTEKIASRIYKIKGVLKNPSPEETDSRLALADKYIFTSLIFDYLKGTEIKEAIADALSDLIKSGKVVYGHEPDGQWLFINDKVSYLEAKKILTN